MQFRECAVPMICCSAVKNQGRFPVTAAIFFLSFIQIFIVSLPHRLLAEGEVIRRSSSETEEEEEEEAYSLGALVMHDAWGNVRGGDHRGAGIMGNFILMGAIDTEKAHWWDDGKFALDSIAVYGRRPSLAVGDYQYTSSIDAYDTVELYQAYYQHSFLDDDVSVLAGIHDYTTEFAVLSYGFAFVNSSFYTPSTITQLPYSFYPFTGLGTRVFTRINEDYMVRAGLYDGKPASQRHGRGMDYGLSGEDGANTIVEAGYEPKNESGRHHAKYVMGAWHNTAEFQDAVGNQRNNNSGGYVLAEQEVLREKDTNDQGLGVFVQVSYSQKDRNFNPWYFGAGIRYKGIFEDRDDDVLALAFAMAETASIVRTIDDQTEGNDRAVELGYRAFLTPDFTITPDIQWVQNPGAKSYLHDSIILYIRSELKL